MPTRQTSPRIPSLKFAIIMQNLTQRRVGIDTGIGEIRLSKIIRGVVIPTRREQRAIAQYLRTSIRALFGSLASTDDERPRRAAAR